MRKFILSALLVTAPTLAQVQLVDSIQGANQVILNNTYTQDFDSLANSGSSFSWTDNSTLFGWYSNFTTYSANGGRGSLGIQGAGDRALGGELAVFGVRIVNNSSATISGLNISYRGEQWLRNANSPQLHDYIYTEYHTFSSESGSLASSDWISAPELTFASPNLAGVGTALLNGNLPENNYVVSGFVVGINLLPGEELWVRWRIIGGDIPFDHTMGIDDVTFSFVAVPEPTTTTALLGLGAMVYTLIRRKVRSGSK